MSQQSRPILFSILAAIFICELLTLFTAPPPLKEQLQQKHKDINQLSFDRPLIVLHKGTSPNQGHIYSTAYWAGWGSGKF